MHPDVPSDIWRYIAGFIPAAVLLTLYSVNRTFLEIATETRYQAISLVAYETAKPLIKHVKCVSQLNFTVLHLISSTGILNSSTRSASSRGWCSPRNRSVALGLPPLGNFSIPAFHPDTHLKKVLSRLPDDCRSRHDASPTPSKGFPTYMNITSTGMKGPAKQISFLPFWTPLFLTSGTVCVLSFSKSLCTICLPYLA